MDAEVPDTGARDSAVPDTGVLDTGVRDASATDTGAPDSGPADAGSCSVSPCRLVSPQCGCAAGTMCAWPDQVGPRVCLPTGAAPVGDLCTTESQCDAEGGCLIAGPGGNGQCVKYCTEDVQCPATSECIDFGWTEPVGFCSRLCDPTTGGGCPSPLVCGVSTAFRTEDDAESIVAFCTPPGAGGQGDTCAGYWECQGGFACVGICAQVCVMASPSCPGDCLPFSPAGIVGGVEYGFCRTSGGA